ncbi:hypothetical protein Ancab_035867, partial [Ancistrocladus abbreviatus]
WRTMLYIASIPGFVLIFGMQFAVESPRWLCKAGRLDDAKAIVHDLWGPSEVDKAIEEFQSVMRSDKRELDSTWLELLEVPHSRGSMIKDSHLKSVAVAFTSYNNNCLSHSI